MLIVSIGFREKAILDGTSDEGEENAERSISRINLNNFSITICYGHLTESLSTYLNLCKSATLRTHDFWVLTAQADLFSVRLAQESSMALLGSFFLKLSKAFKTREL